MSGNVAGVVLGKLDELVIAKETGSLPQNINFAIKSTILQTFLDSHGIDYNLGTSEAQSDAADIAENAQKYTVRITCFE